MWLGISQTFVEFKIICGDHGRDHEVCCLYSIIIIMIIIRRCFLFILLSPKHLECLSSIPPQWNATSLDADKIVACATLRVRLSFWIALFLSYEAECNAKCEY
jgi:hypothetical protein